MAAKQRAINPYEAFQVESGGQDLLATWYPAHDVPDGKRHGSAGICVTDNGDIVLITQDGKIWDFPGGRPEGNESWEEKMRQEVREEACVEVTDAKLLGFLHAECIRGDEKGLVLVRALCLARVQLQEWIPEPETLARKLVPPNQVLSELEPNVFNPLSHRALIVANLPI
jgi:ADP-ribose pyrophosphatase YjhB (NUDIX family)